MKDIKESDLGKIAVDYFTKNGYECYQEVVTIYGRIDLVIKKENYIEAIEIKTNFNLKLLEQANNNLNLANKSSIFIPYLKKGFNKFLLTKLNIGCYQFGYRLNLIKTNDSIINEKPMPLRLNEFQKKFSTAGNNESLFWTDFKNTRLNIFEYLSKNNGVELKVLRKNIKHHYSTENGFNQCIKKLILSKVLFELEIKENKVFLKEGILKKDIFKGEIE
jgi:hypothetical protein